MSLFIVVPVKSLANAKSRLAPLLGESERRSLALSLLRHVLVAVQEAQARLFARCVVVSPDPHVLELAMTYGLTPLQERYTPSPGGSHEWASAGDVESALNAALEQATTYAIAQGASAVMILPADLPLVTADEIVRLWRASQQLYSARAMVIAPDRRDEGTNALLIRPPGALRYQFGPGSFRRHCQQARQLGLAWHVHRSAQLGLDVDAPADLERYLAVERADQEETAMSSTLPKPMISPGLAAFLDQPGLLMRLGTLGQDGYPQVTPVWYLFQDGQFYVTTASDRVKARNMLANPKVGFAIDSDVRPYQGVSVWGEARLVAEGEAARPVTRRIAARYVPAERLEAMVDTLMQSPRVLFVIEPVKVVAMGSWDDPS
jgi:2-phospho-L-lactate guanylyltransferase